MADPSAFIALAREVLAADASASTEEEHWVAKVALQTLAVNALPALLEVAEKAKALLDYHDKCGMESRHGDEMRRAIAALAEVSGE